MCYANADTLKTPAYHSMQPLIPVLTLAIHINGNETPPNETLSSEKST